jgi:hypothetical protein
MGSSAVNYFKLQVVRELFCQLAANMWSIPQAVAERQALVKQRELQKKLYQLNSPGTMPILFHGACKCIWRVSYEKHCICVFITESTGLLAVSYQVLCTDIRWSKSILIDA